MSTTYRLVLYDGTNYNNISEVSKINAFLVPISKENLPNCMIYVVGNDINLDQILNLVSRYNIPITLEKCNLESLEINYIGQTKIIIRSCEVKELKIYGGTVINNSNRTLDIHFINCNVKTSAISECQTLSSFKLTANCIFSKITFLDNNIGAVTITDSTIENQIAFKSNNNYSIGEFTVIENSKIPLSIFSNVNIVKLSVSESVVNKFIVNNSVLTLDISIENCNKVDFQFNDCNIEYGSIVINKITNGHIVFNKTRSNKKLNISSTNCSTSYLYLNQCFFSNEVSFKDSETADQCINLSINETVFKELVIFKENQPQRLELSNTLFQNGVLIPISEEKYGKIITPEKIHSSVWCILKNQAIQRNDKIVALSYRKYEMNAFRNELHSKKGNYEEKIVLFLNNLSNGHGLSWIKGLKFTLYAWVILFSLYTWASNDYYYSFKLNSFLIFQKDFWSEAISFLWLPQGLGGLAENLKSDLCTFSWLTMILLFILGKIVVAYGIYQTISAFRKHGKI